jgi:pimeloyl-ACP methyl ester carboxylesterase
VRPPGKPRPLDEAALLEVTVPTLIVQGDQDELGPLKVLERLVKRNRLLELHVLEGAGHSFGRHEAAALDHAVAWLDRVSTAPKK